jgi:adenylate cyclase
MVQERPVRVERKLSAILAADVAGYSRLMHHDEEATHAKVTALLMDSIKPVIAEHGGRIVKSTGDGFLAEFLSAVEAVRAAVQFQTRIKENANGDAEDRRVVFRVGINIGDVIVEPHDIFGDGVNIAARLEAIAEPGGICISGKVYDEISGKLDLACEDMGLQQLKNIARPVQAYRVDMCGLAGGKSRDSPSAKVPLPLPDRPSIAVLPFANLSSDPEQEYFTDGITEDIITELSRFSELFVIARNSSFQYKGKSVDVRQVGRELGVRYVLEGSIRRAGDRVRITGELVDATTGAHRWADHYDRKLEDMFAVQDEVARTIVAILAAYVSKAEATRTLLKPPSSWLAYDYFLRGADTYNSFMSTLLPETLYEARRLFEGSLSIDPEYARAYAALSNTYTTAHGQPIDSNYLDPTAIERAHELAAKAVQLDPNLPLAHAKLGIALALRARPEEAIAAFERAIALNPNFSDWRFAIPLVFAGQFARAIEVAEAHMRVDPFYPPFALFISGFARYMLGQYLDAVLLLRAGILRAPNARFGRAALAAAYVQLGQLEDARAQATEVLRIEPTYTIDQTERTLRRFSSPQHAEKYFGDLRTAGLPER